MRIISKSHDYYDSAMAWGQDKDVVYVRNEQELKDKADKAKWADLIPGFRCFEMRNKKADVVLMPFCIGFCGKIYRGMRVKLRPILTNLYDECMAEEDHSFYTLENLEAYLARYKHVIDDTDSKRHRWHRTGRDPTYYMSKRKGVDYFLNQQMTNEVEQLMIESRVAVVSALEFSRYRDDMELTLDPQLKKFEFFKVVDPFTAYQELDMYIGGVLPRPGVMTAEIEDKYRIPQHGFDKWSFRKMPQEKKNG